MKETTPQLMGRALPAALQMLSTAGTSCVLSITSEQGVATIALAKGKVAWATSNESKRIGDVLVEKGFVDRDVLGVVLSIQKRKRMRHPVCTIMCELGLIAAEVAEAEIAAQTTDVLLSVLGWGRGTLRVEPIEFNENDATVAVDQSVETLLVRVALLRDGFAGATSEVTCDGTVAVQ